MRYTYQEISESGSFGAPYGDDIKHANGKEELERALGRWEYEHERVGADGRDATLNVWIGTLDDVTDIYPDMQAYYGPRGGFIFCRV